MNHSVYYFASSPERHMQYPMDFSSVIFSKYAEEITTESAISVRRENELVYYTYLRRLSSESKGKTYFGICIVFNGIITYNIQALFKIFERSFEQIVISGKMLQFSDNGEVMIEPIGWESVENSSSDISSKINSYLDDGVDYFEPIPPINYGASYTETAFTSLLDGNEAIRMLITNYQTTFITKTYDLSSKHFNSYASKLAKLQEENYLQKSLISNLRSKRNGIGFFTSISWVLFVIAVLAISLIAIGYFTGHILFQ